MNCPALFQFFLIQINQNRCTNTEQIFRCCDAANTDCCGDQFIQWQAKPAALVGQCFRKRYFLVILVSLTSFYFIRGQRRPYPGNKYRDDGKTGQELDVFGHHVHDRTDQNFSQNNPFNNGVSLRRSPNRGVTTPSGPDRRRPSPAAGRISSEQQPIRRARRSIFRREFRKKRLLF